MADDDSLTEEATTFRRWNAELDYAQKDETYKKWVDRSELIVKRYRDERKQSTAEFGKRRYNILWSNVQTLAPAIYGKMPKPIAERRFLDRDPAARLASQMLERVLDFQMETCGFHAATDKSVLDYLLPGMGQIWVRYAPEFEAEEIAEANEQIEAEQADEPTGQQIDDGDGTPYEKLSYERVIFDYVFWRDFLWGPARCWAEVPWVAKRCWLDKSEATEAFGEEIAKKMTFGDPKSREFANAHEPMQLGKSKKAEVWEIWNKANRCVYFISPDTPDLVLKTEEDDPLKLEGFWPCAEPLFATQTNETLVPVPDYVEYQDQAAELDTLTQRIAVVTTAIRANGVYDASVPSLQRLLQEGQDNKLIPVDQWAAFAEKGGVAGALQLVPMQEIVEVLTQLYEARDKVKEDIYEITGMSDIVRGATDPNETASAQQIKSGYASGRLGARQEQVAEFCAEVIKIAAQIISEVFSPDSLSQMSGLDQINKEAVQKAVEGVQPPPKPQLPQGQPQAPGQPPGAPPNQQLLQQAMQQWQRQFDELKRQAAIQAQETQNKQFEAAVGLLRNDKLRGFRVDIETDSTIAGDTEADKAGAIALITGTFQALEGAQPIVAAAPELAKPIGEMLMWAFRKYRVGRVLEASLEDALDQLDARIEAQKNQPPQPNPEMIQAQADVQVANAKASEAQVSAQAEAARAKSDIMIKQAELAGDQKAAQLQAQLDASKIQVDQLEAAADNQTQMKLAYIEYLGKVRVAEIAAGVKSNESQVDAKLEVMLGLLTAAQASSEAALDRQHDQDMQKADQQHQQTMQENAPKPGSAA